MLEIVLYGFGFCICTILLQGFLFKVRKNHNKGNSAVWIGNSAIVLICVMGIATQNINHFASILGFVVGDEVGGHMGWH